jgi:hypothetical protein
MLAAILLLKFLYVCSTIISADLPTMCGDVIFYYQTTPYTANQQEFSKILSQ